MTYKNWLEPIQPMLTTWISPNDRELLTKFDYALSSLSSDAVTNTPLKVKSILAAQGYGMIDVDYDLGGKGRSPILQALIQFICGYYGLDYRGVANVGHGRMVVMHGSDKQLDFWVPKMNKGALIGIAATEERGGSNIKDIRSIARREGKKYLLTGKKYWISRLKEASVFIVFFRFDRDETISAALIEPSRDGFKIETLPPSGLDGWSWGKISFENLSLTDQDLLGARGNGTAMFKDHFVYYRPMVAITALGVAASVIDKTLAHLNMRVSKGYIQEPRDSALESIADHYTSVNAGILSSICAIVQNVEDTAYSSLWSRCSKAWSVDEAYQAVSKMALLIGAASFQFDNFVAKALRDLRGLLFADGIHDALRRSSGRTLVNQTNVN